MSRFASRKLALASIALFALASAPAFAADENGPARSCDANIPDITSGYGANGSYRSTRQYVKHPSYNEDVEVFLPSGKTDRSPVMFFIHAYGPNVSGAYYDLIRHVVSRGTIVVFASYPDDNTTMKDRYNIMWSGIVRATEVYANQMDLTRVAVVGHSIGGGAVPTIAYHTFTERGWGSAGGLAYSLAPWYTNELTDAQWSSIPKHIVFATQVYDQDTVNDHRMAINQYNVTPGQIHLYSVVHTLAAGDCLMNATHYLPGQGVSNSLRIKQYGLFRPLDALTDMVFYPGATSAAALQTLSEQLRTSTGYQPLELFAPATTNLPQTNFEYPWDSAINPAAKKTPTVGMRR